MIHPPSVADDLATLRQGIKRLAAWNDCSCDRTYHDACPDHGVYGQGFGPSGKAEIALALASVAKGLFDQWARLQDAEAEVARLQIGNVDRSRLPITTRTLIERAEAAEAEVARLRDGLRLVLRGIPDPMHPSIRPEWVDKMVAAQIVALDLFGENDGEDVEHAGALLAEDGAACRPNHYGDRPCGGFGERCECQAEDGAV